MLFSLRFTCGKLARAQIWSGIPSWMEARVHGHQRSHSHILIRLTVYSVNIEVQRFPFQIQQREVGNRCELAQLPMAHQSVETRQQLTDTKRTGAPRFPLAVCPILVREYCQPRPQVLSPDTFCSVQTYTIVSIYNSLMRLGLPCDHHGLQRNPHDHFDGCSGSKSMV